MTNPIRASRFLALGLTVTAGILPLPAAAASTAVHQLDEMLPGLKPKQVYDVAGIEQVNLFSGDPHLAIPLGPAYPLSSGSSFQLTAHYSAKIWRVSSGLCIASEDNCSMSVYVSRAHVTGHPTLGVGWTLELGFIAPQTLPYGEANGVLWRTSDGGSHECRVDPSNSSGGCTDANVRIRKPNPDEYRVTYPDGTTHVYGHKYVRPEPANGYDFNDEDRFEPKISIDRYGLSQIIDRFGTPVLDVSYVADYGDAANGWKVSGILLRRGDQDPACRTCSTISYNWRANPPNGWAVLDSIDFPQSNATGGAGERTTFSFRNRPEGAPGLLRTPLETGWEQECKQYELSPPEADLPFLEGISRSGIQQYSFSYSLTSDQMSLTNGVLASITLPTGGSISYEYLSTGGVGVCRFPEGTCGSPEKFPADLLPPNTPLDDGSFDRCTDAEKRRRFVDSSPAVSRRTEFDPFSGSTSITRYYRRTFASPEYVTSPYPEPIRTIRRVLVDRPSGNGENGRTFSAHYFAAAPFPGIDPVELESRVWHEPSGTPSPSPNRSTVHCFEGIDLPNEPLEVCGILEIGPGGRTVTVAQNNRNNRRHTKEVTWYGANPFGGGDCSMDATVACHQTAFSGGFNVTAREYPVATQSICRTGNGPSIFLAPADWVSRVTTTDLRPVATASKWLPGLFDSRTVSDNYTTGCSGDNSYRAPCTTLTRYQFNQGDGFLEKASRVNPSDGAETLLTEYGKGALGDPETETKSGAGGVVSPTTFVTNRLFQHGLVTRSSRSNVPGGWSSFRVDRDPVTGLVTTSYDPNGLQTTFGYDVLGRLVSITPPGGETPSRYAYFDFDPATSARTPYLVAKQSEGDPSATDDGVPGDGSGTVEAYQYDAFGRVLRQVRRLANPLLLNDQATTGSYFAFQESRYDAAGHLSFLSEWTPCDAGPSETDLYTCFGSVASKGTTWSNFDFLGRPRRIELADGKVTTKSFDDPEANIPDSDTAEITTVGDVGGNTVTSFTRKDLFGRLLAVSDPAEKGSPYTSYFDYNTFDSLVRARILESQGFAQKRSFTYNALGLLVSEKIPEKTSESQPATGEFTTYDSYDALGNVLSKSVNGTSYSYSYDAMGRLTAASSGTLSLENTYDESTGTPLHTNFGRLTTRMGSNPGLPSVTEAFDYSAATGRPTSKTTSFSSGPLPAVTEKLYYNRLGLLATHNHPRPSGLFSVSTTYRSGLPVSVTANGLPVVEHATYHPAGNVASYTTGNGSGHSVTTTIGIDGNTWMPRPDSISTSGASSNLETGTYAYDGVGNVLSIGSDLFTYDSRSRLTGANFGLAGIRSYTYDDVGNMTSNGAASFSPSALTNHILSDSLDRTYRYDSRGNQTAFGSETYAWDAFDRMTSYQKASASWRYAYTGANERVLQVPTEGLHWGQYTLRDTSNRVATQLLGNGTGTDWSRDNVYLGNLLVGSYQSCASQGSSGWQYTGSDHLGTPRVATDPNGTTVWQKKYWPYGEESGDTPPQPLTFALMEKDAKIDAADSDRFYDHARTHSGTLGRFLSPDMLGGKLEDPQSINRYAYARNNPLKYVDPDGRTIDYSPAFKARIKSDPVFRNAHQNWFNRPSGRAQFHKMGGDATVYRFDLGGPLARGRRAYGYTHPEGLAQPQGKDYDKNGKLNYPVVIMEINADLRMEEAGRQPPGYSISDELSKTTFHEGEHGLDQGSGSMTIDEAYARESALTGETDPAIIKFKLERKAADEFKMAEELRK